MILLGGVGEYNINFKTSEFEGKIWSNLERA